MTCSGDDNVHLKWMRDILITYAVFHPDVGYSQGMNDILSLILYVLDNEVSAARSQARGRIDCRVFAGRCLLVLRQLH